MMTGKTKRGMRVSSMFVVCGTRVREVIWIHRPPPPVVVQQLTNEWLVDLMDRTFMKVKVDRWEAHSRGRRGQFLIVF
jgi:hypothetical protein